MKTETEQVELNWLATPENIVINYDGETHLIPRTESRSDKLIDCLKKKDYNQIKKMLDAGSMIEDFSDGEFSVKNGSVYINDFILPDSLGKKILEFMDQELPHEPLVNFAKKLMNNPSNKSLLSLYKFLEHNEHPITPNGNFIAYKSVREDFKDCYSGKFDNSPGKTVQVPRNQVDENIEQTCSYGLHVANWDYANNIYRGTVTVEVEVDPADVVAVPSDYNNAKMRVCKYIVRNEVKNSHKKTDLLVDNYDDSLDYEEDDDALDDYEDDLFND